MPIVSSFTILEEVGRGANSSFPSSFREEQHPLLPPIIVLFE
jgi:hypothetical protein